MRQRIYLYQLWLRLKRNRLAMGCLGIIIIYILIALSTQLGWLAASFDLINGNSYEPPSLRHWLGTDFMGRDVLQRTLHGSRIALTIGLITSIISIPIGTLLGAIAGYFGGWVDELIVWFYSVLSSIPSLLLLIAFSYVLGKGIFAVYIAIGLTAWVQVCRQVRGEFIKHY
jgi:peptide/nickel transport system permease protein